MGKLRNTIKAQFTKILDKSSFTAEDFQMVFGDPEMLEPVVRITFLHDKNFYLKFTEGGWEDPYWVERNPGDIHEVEKKMFHNFDDIFPVLEVWASEIRLELEAQNSSYKDIGELRKIIDEAINSSINDDDDDEFSVEEINNLRKKFADLEQRVTELEKQQIITSNQKKEFSKGLETVSENLEILPKKTWLKTSVNKLAKTVSTIAKSREGRSLLADGARKLLGLE